MPGLAVRRVAPLELVDGEVLRLGVDGDEAPLADDTGHRQMQLAVDGPVLPRNELQLGEESIVPRVRADPEPGDLAVLQETNRPISERDANGVDRLGP